MNAVTSSHMQDTTQLDQKMLYVRRTAKTAVERIHDIANMKHKKIAVLATDGFEQVELTEPVKTLREHGANVTIIS
jgi:translation initiation factor 2B subunit (eIF-2B alpha/beta/delta family)